MNLWKKRNKYGNIRKHCLAGHNHQSSLEADHCNRLWAMKKNGDIKDYEIQKVFNLCWPTGLLICRHVVDFLVTTKTGEIQVHETKGHATMLWKIKKQLFYACYPQIPYIVIRKN